MASGEPFDIWAPKLRNALGQFASVAREIMVEAAKHGETRAKGYAPVDTGELRANIQGTVEARGTGSATSQSRLFLSAPAKYAPIEFGSRRGHRAQRFLERGMEDAIDYLEREVLRQIPDLIIKGRVGHIGPRFSNRTIDKGGR